MALRIKQQIVDEIIYELYGGTPTVSRAISDNFVVTKLNNHLAGAAIEVYQRNGQLATCSCIDDIFYLTFTGLTLNTDPVLGVKYFAHPSQPIGLPQKQSIIISPPANRGGVREGIFKPIQRSEVSKVRSLPGVKKVFHYTDNGNEYFVDEFGIMDTFTSVNLSVASAGANDLTAFVNMPDDMIEVVKTRIIAELRAMLSVHDTTPIPQADADQVR